MSRDPARAGSAPGGPSRGEGAWVVAEAPAKLNLALAVLGRRDDGYHDLLTVFQAIDLTDSLLLKERDEPGVYLRIEGTEPVPPGSDNLVVRAGEVLLRETGLRRGAEIVLTKRIPVGAGLGGGSSDAAAALLGLEALWGVDVGADTRAALALELGSDVPFFLLGGTALGEGRGERLTSLPPPPSCGWVLIVPDWRLRTADVFGALPMPLTNAAQEVRILVDALRQGEWGRFAGHLVNDLEVGVVRIQPRLAAIKAGVLAQGAAALGLTGSGSAMFALFRSQGEAASALKGGFTVPGTRVIACDPVAFGARITARSDQGAFRG
jgi:4-diphosphocytidyl-2-C-methyl-D-erythritol kinase